MRSRSPVGLPPIGDARWTRRAGGIVHTNGRQGSIMHRAHATSRSIPAFSLTPSATTRVSTARAWSTSTGMCMSAGDCKAGGGGGAYAHGPSISSMPRSSMPSYSSVASFRRPPCSSPVGVLCVPVPHPPTTRCLFLRPSASPRPCSVPQCPANMTCLKFAVPSCAGRVQAASTNGLRGCRHLGASPGLGPPLPALYPQPHPDPHVTTPYDSLVILPPPPPAAPPPLYWE